ncbi:MAG: threonylcarbamoyl-AMP synthase [Chlamydiae bacterium CG10_big_fil_rev_8_21_14_0_10_42_34]|nr:MAG: threonylcarbamoyl-AMP synthase [Chlamydiae bacterium CG10_big_fil_rev_8_21_14_0_10_42_34]
MDRKVYENFDFSLAIDALEKGDPIIFPTETVYGLGAPLFNIDAVRRIFSIKGRPTDNPLIAHIGKISDAKSLSDDLPTAFYTLAEAFWPGPLAIVVKKNEKVPSIVSAGHPTIAIRMPSHPIARALIEAFGQPLVAPSANLSGKPSPTTLADALEDLNGKVNVAIDGGPCDVGIESTVISLVHEAPTLLRPGKITKEMLEEVLGVPIALPPSSGPVLSPGMKYRHYAPIAPVRLVYKIEELQGPFIIPTAKSLYSQLRHADRMGMELIEIYCDITVQSDAALMNRLLRSAGQIG